MKLANTTSRAACRGSGRNVQPYKPHKAVMIRKLLKGAVKDAMSAKEFDIEDKATQAFGVVSDLDHALSKELAFEYTSEQEYICSQIPWEHECRIYDI